MFSLTKVQKFLALAIGIHIVLEFLFPSMYGDQFMQINSFYNYIDGHGVTINVAYPDNLSNIVYEKLNLWALGFIGINVPFWHLFHNISLAVLILNILSIILFFVSIYKILGHLKYYIGETHRIYILLFFAVCIMPSRYMGSTDVWCLGLLFYYFSILLDIILLNYLHAKQIYFRVFILSLIAALMLSTRYTYWLFICLGPSVFLFYGLLKNKKLIPVAIWLAILSFGFSFGYIWGHYQYFQKIFPTSVPVHPTLQWRSLGLYNPLVFNTLYRDTIVRNLFTALIHGKQGLYLFQILAHVLGIIIIIPVLISIKNIIFRIAPSWKARLNSEFGVFLLCSMLLMGINNLTIIYSTLRFGILDIARSYPMGYAVVAEVRYFAPTLVLIYIFIIIAIENSPKKNTKKLLNYTVLSGFLFAILINTVFVLARMDIAIPKVLKYIHYDDSNIKMYQYMNSNYSQNTLFLRSPYSDLLDDYMVKYARLTEIKHTDWKNLRLATQNPVKVLSIIDSQDTTLRKYSPKIVLKSIKPNLDLVEFSIFPSENK